jgi:hypothetical protein
LELRVEELGNSVDVIVDEPPTAVAEMVARVYISKMQVREEILEMDFVVLPMLAFSWLFAWLASG